MHGQGPRNRIRARSKRLLPAAKGLGERPVETLRLLQVSVRIMRALHTPLLAVALAASALAANTRPAASLVPRESPELIWEQVIQTDSFEYKYLNAALSRGDDGVWVLYGLTPKGSMASPQSFQLTHLDGSGKTVGQF